MFFYYFLAWFVQRFQWEAQDKSSDKGTGIQTSGWKTEGTTDRTSQPHGWLRPRQGQEKCFSGKFRACTGCRLWCLHTCTGCRLWCLHTARHRNRYRDRYAELCGGSIHTTQRQISTQIPIGFCINLLVPVPVSVPVCVSVSGSINVPLHRVKRRRRKSLMIWSKKFVCNRVLVQNELVKTVHNVFV